MSIPFRTEYRGATYSRGATIAVTSLTSVAGKTLRVVIGYPHDAATPHTVAASAFIAKHFPAEIGREFRQIDVGTGYIYSSAGASRQVRL